MLMMCSELDVDAMGQSLCGIPRSVEQWSVLKNNVCTVCMGAASNP